MTDPLLFAVSGDFGGISPVFGMEHGGVDLRLVMKGIRQLVDGWSGHSWLRPMMNPTTKALMTNAMMATKRANSGRVMFVPREG